jgi:hypothetical protein
MRKLIAGWFIRAGQRIYRPTVEEMAAQVKEIIFADGSACPLKPTMIVNNHGIDPDAAIAAAERVWERRNAAGGFGR